MKYKRPCNVEVEPFKCLLLEMAQERSLDSLLSLIVRRLAEQSHVALARIWLMDEGDICDSCLMRKECPDQTSCLHLVASAGNPIDKSEDWSRLNGDFRRMPRGVRKVGHIAATGEPVEVVDITEDSKWLARPDWAEREEILGFGGQPLVFEEQVLGVLVVFSREQFRTRLVSLDADDCESCRGGDCECSSVRRDRAIAESAGDGKTIYLKEEVREAHAFGDIVGQSPALQTNAETDRAGSSHRGECF